MVNNLAGYALSIVGAIFIGALGALPLSASVLANSIYNCTGLSLALGLSAGMETLCGQAFGAGAYEEVGVVLQRALLVCWAVCIPVAALWLNSHALLLSLGQQPDIAALASRYLILCTPCLFITTAMECVRRYLQAQRAVKPAMVVAGVTLAASPALFWLFVVRAGLGLDGAAFAFIACQAATLAGLVGCVVARARAMRGRREQTWGGWSADAFKGWPTYISYGVPAALMIGLEWWAYEAVLILAGLLPNAEVALSTMGICLNINAWMYMLPLGLGAAVNTSISNALGAGHAETARRAFLGGIASGVLLQAALSGSIIAHGRSVVGLFTNDAAVIASCCDVLPLCGRAAPRRTAPRRAAPPPPRPRARVAHRHSAAARLAGLVFFDGVNAVVSGVLRGSGRQLLGAAINALGYWAIGTPLAAWLAFAGGPGGPMGLPGFWVGVATGACVQAVVLLAMLLRWDWRAEVARVQRALAEAAAAGRPPPAFGH
ncbi:DTX2 [Scenedesmus sp. PABB004]|nr:DTX2 [Scenedesmus sp. PABB004]